MLETAVLILLIVVALIINGLILIQQGKGADMGASFGSGASNTVFGSAGSGNFLTHSTAVLAAVFFVCCLALGWFAHNHSASRGSVDFSAPATESKPAPIETDVPRVKNDDASTEVPATSAATTAAPSSVAEPSQAAEVPAEATPNASVPAESAVPPNADAAPESSKVAQ
ncbi:Protein-export membrane protein [gamma proteobacterium HdN1]|nr:Protein-export membrane protein [gamma proteobacterium HdN1]